MTLSRNHILRAWPALLLFAGGCGSTATTPTDTSAVPTPTPETTITVAASPDTVTVSASSEAGYTWTGSFVATITNTNTSPLTVRSITADLQQSSAGIVVTPLTGTDELFRFDMRAPGNRADANGTLAIPFTFHYTLPNAGREALVSLSFNVLTDAGASGAITASVKFQ